MPQLNLKPTIKQDLCYQVLDNDTVRFPLFGGGAGGGKSWLGCEWILRNCYLYPRSKWFIGRKELKRLMTTTYITWLKVCRHHSIPRDSWKLNGQYNYIEFTSGKAKGSRVDLLDVGEKPSDPLYERFGSLECTGGWIEEAGEVSFMAFDVLKSRIGRHMNAEYDLLPKMLLTCNPTQNWLFRVFYRPYRDKTMPSDYAFIPALHNDNPYHPSSYADQLEALEDPILRARLLEGRWEYSLDDLAIIDYEAILAMFEQEVEASIEGYVSADIARYGSDKVTIGIWKGLNLYDVHENHKQSLTITAGKLQEIMFKERIPYKRCVVDEDGVGGGVVDHLEGVQGFMGNRSPILRPDDEVETEYLNVPKSYLKKQNYKNLRTQCHFLLAQKINNHEISISAKLDEKTKEMIIEELQRVKRVDTSADEPLRIVPKAEIKEAIGRSPDYSDMLMMRMYFELTKEMGKSAYNPPNIDKMMNSKAISDFGGVEWD